MRQSWHVEIDEALAVDPLTQDPGHFTFTWRDVDRVRNYRESQGKALIGWYHTHPDFGVFLSETDLSKTHRILFAEPFQVALVYDPVRGRAGYFFWEGPQVIDASRAAWREFEIAIAAEEAPAPDRAAGPDTASIPRPSPPAPAEALAAAEPAAPAGIAPSVEGGVDGAKPTA